jgi:nucleotide-binding universal stress UspA family protein
MLLAWDGSPPSARAMRAALPFMAHAAEVHVATWAAHVPTAPYSGVDASAWLNRHGIASQVHQRGPTHHLANELASMVARLDADLVVMGCYGHSRLRERVFGGATRASLASLPVPVLMAH